MTNVDLISSIEQAGASVVFLPSFSLPGAFHARKNLVIINSTMPAREQRATLAHELIHVLRKDDGPQPPHIEALVDRAAARLLISPIEYQIAERIVGCVPGALAEELDVPVWVIHAWQDAYVCESVNPCTPARCLI